MKEKIKCGEPLCKWQGTWDDLIKKEKDKLTSIYTCPECGGKGFWTIDGPDGDGKYTYTQTVEARQSFSVRAKNADDANKEFESIAGDLEMDGWETDWTAFSSDEGEII